VVHNEKLKPIWATQLRTYASTLLNSLASSRRFELLGQLFETMDCIETGLSIDIVSVCEPILPHAVSRFQHVLLRYLPLRNSSNLKSRPGWNAAAAKAEFLACAEICRASNLTGLRGMALDHRCKINNLVELAEPRPVLDHTGHYRATMELDFTKLKLVLDEHGASTNFQLRVAVKDTVKHMFLLDNLLIGSNPVHGINTVLFTYLLNTISNLASQANPDVGMAVFLPTLALETYKAMLARGRGPTLSDGRKLLRNAIDLLDKFYKVAFSGIYTFSEDMCRLRYELSDLLHRDLLQTAKEQSELLELSAVSTTYAEKAIIWTRWLETSSEMEIELERIEEFLTHGILKDVERGRSYDAVSKCCLLMTITLYHPQRAHITTIEHSGECYSLALRLLGQSHIWTANESHRGATASLELTRGAWLAWTGAGRGRKPRYSDYWTYDWMTLGLDPNQTSDPTKRAVLDAENSETHISIVRDPQRLDPMLRNCVREISGMFDEL
jgi:hypothetical protein